MNTPSAPARAIATVAGLAAILAAPILFAAAPPDKAASPKAAPAPISVPIAIDGRPVRVTLKPAGRPGQLTFQAKAGQRLGFGISGVKFTPASAAALIVTVRQADGTMVPGVHRVRCMAATPENPKAGCDGEFTVAKAGRHVIDIDPPFSAVPEFSATLSTPVAATLKVGASQKVTISRVGQDARLQLALEPDGDASVSATTSGEAGPFTMRVFKPDGTLLGERSGDSKQGPSLPATGAPGTYAIEIDPANGATGTFVVSAKPTPAIAIDGPPLEFASSGSGDVVRARFSANAGQSVSVAVDGLKHSPDVPSPSVFGVLKPDGTPLNGMGCSTRAPEGEEVIPCKVPLFDLPDSGRYTVLFTPAAGASASGRLVLSEAFFARVVPGTPAKVPPLKPSQVARFAFDGTAGQKVDVRVSGIATSPPSSMVTVILQRTDGGRFNIGMTGIKDTITMPTGEFRESGKYAVTLDPGSAKIDSAEVAVVLTEGKSK
jgi:trimeric autotransporter adhesin